MTDLVEFLRARLDEDEALARVIVDGDHWHGIHVDSATEVAVHVERHDPARVLREVEVKRRLIELHGSVYTLRLLALPYADHPDYREEP